MLVNEMNRPKVILILTALVVLVCLFAACGTGGGSVGASTTSTTSTTRSVTINYLYRIVCTQEGNFFGRAAATVGDVNSDGFADFLIGANGVDPGGTGAAYVYSGYNLDVLCGGPIYGSAATDLFGWAAAGVGYIDAGSVPDFIVSAIFAGPSAAGTVRVCSGVDASAIFTLSGAETADIFGYSVAGLGDINTDGAGDFIIGAPQFYPGYSPFNKPGKAYVISGLTHAAMYTMTGEANNDAFGFKVAGGSGLFIVGAPFADPGGRVDAGKTYIYSSSTGALLVSISGEVAGDRFGWSADVNGDINGDSSADFVIGSPGFSSDKGKFQIFSGLTKQPVYESVGVAAGDQLGYSVAGVGDLDGDGVSDLIVGAIGADSPGVTNNGAAYVFSGADQTLLYLVTGEAANIQFGEQVAKAGAVNGAGTAGFIVTSIATVEGRSNAGYVEVFVP